MTAEVLHAQPPGWRSPVPVLGAPSQELRDRLFGADGPVTSAGRDRLEFCASPPGGRSAGPAGAQGEARRHRSRPHPTSRERRRARRRGCCRPRDVMARTVVRHVPVPAQPGDEQESRARSGRLCPQEPLAVATPRSPVDRRRRHQRSRGVGAEEIGGPPALPLGCNPSPPPRPSGGARRARQSGRGKARFGRGAPSGSSSSACPPNPGDRHRPQQAGPASGEEAPAAASPRWGGLGPQERRTSTGGASGIPPRETAQGHADEVVAGARGHPTFLPPPLRDRVGSAAAPPVGGGPGWP